jgi:hypothetical protein
VCGRSVGAGVAVVKGLRILLLRYFMMTDWLTARLVGPLGEISV